MRAVEVVKDVALEYLSFLLLVEAFDDIPLIQTNITLLTSPNRFNPADLSQNISIENLNKSVDDKVLIVVGFNLLTKRQTSLKRLLPLLKKDGYMLTHEKCDVTEYNTYLQQYNLNIILDKRINKNYFK